MRQFVCLEDSDPDLVNPATGLPRYAQELPDGPTFDCVVFGTEDGSAFDWTTLCDCLEAIEQNLVSGGTSYVHCFGGHGRAGVVAACLVGMAHGLPAAAALAATQRAHDARQDPAWPLLSPQPSPQTAVQRRQVELLLGALP